MRQRSNAFMRQLEEEDPGRSFKPCSPHVVFRGADSGSLESQSPRYSTYQTAQLVLVWVTSGSLNELGASGLRASGWNSRNAQTLCGIVYPYAAAVVVFA